jgi:ADP-heptose:LPS heptosyltransferase
MTEASSLVLDGVANIAVLCPHRLGDFVFALPALHALKHTYPHARLALVGQQWHADFLRDRPGPVDRVLVMPPVPGVGLPPGRPPDPAPADCLVDGMCAGLPPDDAPDPAPAQHFLEGIRTACFDLAVQMVGGGRYSNPLVRRFGARLAIGARADDAPPLDRWVRYAEPCNRRLALLEVAALAGASAPLLPRELALAEADRREAAAVLPEMPGERLVVLQPGSTDPRRCWPAERFAAVGDALASAGAQVAINGSAAEAPLVRKVAGAMRHPALDLAGRLGLRGLCGLLARARIVVSNDTGPLHLALALGTPSVGIFWLTNLIGGTPLRQGLLSAAVSVRVHCPVCGAPNLTSRCAHDPSFVDDVPLEEVTSRATSLLRAVG